MGRREEWEQQGSDDLGNGAPAGDPCEQPMTRGLSRFASLSPPSPMEYRFDHLSLSLSLPSIRASRPSYAIPGRIRTRIKHFCFSIRLMKYFFLF